MKKKLKTLGTIFSIILSIFAGIITIGVSFVLLFYMFLNFDFGTIISVSCIEIFSLSISYALLAGSKKCIEEEFGIFKKNLSSTKKD